MKFSRVLILILTLLGLFTAAAQGANREVILTETKAGQREAVLLRAGPGPRPTVIILHGRLTTAKATISRYFFDEVGAAHGFNTVFANGHNLGWQDGRQPSARTKVDDVAYLKALVAQLVKDKVAVRHRIFLLGISNGGMMSYALACQGGRMFAGIATIVSSMPAAYRGCSPEPVPLLAINATKDRLIPFDGGEVAGTKRQGEVIGARQTIEKFARANGCTDVQEQKLRDSDPKDGMSIVRRDWQGCRKGLSVTAYDILGGGHAVSGRKKLNKVHAWGKASPDIDSAKVIMDYFSGIR